MTNYKKMHELIHLVVLAIATCHYGRAEKLYQQLLHESFESKDAEIIAYVAKSFIVFRQHRAIDSLLILKRIDPLQSQRKELS